MSSPSEWICLWSCSRWRMMSIWGSSPLNGLKVNQRERTALVPAAKAGRAAEGTRGRSVPIWRPALPPTRRAVSVAPTPSAAIGPAPVLHFSLPRTLGAAFAAATLLLAACSSEQQADAPPVASDERMVAPILTTADAKDEIGRASCRERVCQYV